MISLPASKGEMGWILGREESEERRSSTPVFMLWRIS